MWQHSRKACHKKERAFSLPQEIKFCNPRKAISTLFRPTKVQAEIIVVQQIFKGDWL